MDDRAIRADDWLSFVDATCSKIEEPSAGEADAADDNPLGIWDGGTDDYNNIPPRGWLLGKVFCRRFLSSLIAEGAVGKTAVRMAQLISMALGSSLTGEHVHLQCRVLIVSLEDDPQELRRRVYAVLRRYNIDQRQLSGWLFLAAPKTLKLAELQAGAPVAGKLEKYLRQAIAKHKIDVVSLDPFIKTHGLEENNNNALDFVCGILASISVDLDCAVDIPHHANKGTAATPGDVNRARGGTAMKDAARLCYTLTRMTAEEANALGVGEAERLSLIRMDSAKVNIAPPTREAKWFRLIGVPLGNENDLYPHGDEVQAIEPWEPSALWSEASTPLLHAVLDDIDGAVGLTEGRRYTVSSAAKERAAWPVVLKHLSSKSEKQAKAIIHQLMKSGLLFEQIYHDPVERKPRKGLHLDQTKRPSSCSAPLGKS